MGALAEYVRKEAELIRTELSRREDAKKEWETALGLLTDRLRQWVNEADGGLGLLEAVGGRPAGEPADPDRSPYRLRSPQATARHYSTTPSGRVRSPQRLASIAWERVHSNS